MLLSSLRITFSFRIENTCKIIESNCKPNTVKSTTKPCRCAVEGHVLNTSRSDDSATSLGQPVPVLDKPSGKEIFPNNQSKLSLVQLEVISSCLVTCHLGKETTPTSLQTLNRLNWYFCHLARELKIALCNVEQHHSSSFTNP